MGLIFDIKKFALHDGPGIRTTLFFKGCPLSCPWCHNPEGQRKDPELMWTVDRCLGCADCVEICPHDALSFEEEYLHLQDTLCDACGKCVATCCTQALEMVGKEMTVEKAMEEIKKDVPFYDQSGGGVTFSGGEPLLQSHFLNTILRSCKEEDIHTAVDTCGYGSTTEMRTLVPYVDLFLYDIKVIDSEKHVSLTGKSNALILKNLTMLVQQNCTIWVRYPVIPSCNDHDTDITALGDFLTSQHIERIFLLPYHCAGTHKRERLLNPSPASCSISPPSDGHIEQISTKLKEAGLQVTVGG